MKEVKPDGVWMCALKCAAPCLGVCAIDTTSPIMDAVGTTSGYASGYDS
ncbi:MULTISPECIES: huazacin family RiPP peptide [unclassified Geobacillus]